MKPFLCSILKCDKCNSSDSFRITPIEVSKVPVPATLPKVSDFKTKLEFLSELTNSISKIGQNLIDISDVDVQLFLETEDFTSEEHLKIVDLLYGIDITTGSITCINCDNVKNIRNGILIYNE